MTWNVSIMIYSFTLVLTKANPPLFCILVFTCYTSGSLRWERVHSVNKHHVVGTTATDAGIEQKVNIMFVDMVLSYENYLFLLFC